MFDNISPADYWQTTNPSAGQPGTMAEQFAIASAYQDQPKHASRERRMRTSRRLVLPHARGDIERAAHVMRSHAVKATNAVKASLTLEVLDLIRGVTS